jgi:AraC-like DNA-binding protein
MGLSRSQLYRKTKALTHYSPNELLRIVRLQKAMELINTLELSVSEIAYRVGFTSPSYFAKCFKDYYDKSPTDYQK